ncbi:MAG: response regulator [bacterium]|nr:response regulator [bacterium]
MSNHDDHIREPEKEPEEEKTLILMVDDVAMNLQILGNILRRRGYRVAPANNGIQALEVIEELQPDLVLLDIMMPELDGYEVCRRIKENPKVNEIPVIFITAKVATEDIVEGFKAGAIDYVTKPFNPSELLARVSTHLELKKSRDREKKLVKGLKDALSKVKLLSGLLPMCSNCKKIRDDGGYWQQVEEYIGRHSEAHFSHSLCPDCVRSLYPEIADKILSSTD